MGLGTIHDYTADEIKNLIPDVAICAMAAVPLNNAKWDPAKTVRLRLPNRDVIHFDNDGTVTYSCNAGTNKEYRPSYPTQDHLAWSEIVRLVARAIDGMSPEFVNFLDVAGSAARVEIAKAIITNQISIARDQEESTK